jgi:hypothetical protein
MADIAHLTRGNQVIEGAEGFIDRRFRVGAVNLIEVAVVAS